MKLFRKPSNSRSAGFSLAEVSIGSVFLISVLAATTTVAVTGQRVQSASSKKTQTNQQAKRTVTRIVEEAMGAGKASLSGFSSKPFWDDKIKFERIVSVDPTSGDVLWDWTKIEFRLAKGEENDGRDNNGNGLVDEGTVVLVKTESSGHTTTTEETTTELPKAPIQTASTHEVILCDWVREHLEGEKPNGKDDNGNGLIDERGLCFSLDGDLLTIYLTIEKLDADKHLVANTISTTIALRN